SHMAAPYNAVGFTGKSYDAKAGLVDFGARWYSPNEGRFTTMDTFAGWSNQPLTLNRYSYVHNNPVNFTDPSGHCETTSDSDDTYCIPKPKPPTGGGNGGSTPPPPAPKPKPGAGGSGGSGGGKGGSGGSGGSSGGSGGGGPVAPPPPPPVPTLAELIAMARTNYNGLAGSIPRYNGNSYSGYGYGYSYGYSPGFVNWSEFGGGIADGAKSTWAGLKYLVKHPVKTGTHILKLGTGIPHPELIKYKYNVAKTIVSDARKYIDESSGSRVAGRATFEIASVLVGTKGLSNVTKVGRVAKPAAVARENVGVSLRLEDTVKPKPYSNPNRRPNYGKGQVDIVWENAKDIDGKVYDPNTGEELFWDKSKSRAGQWDMGHTPENKYSNWHEKYIKGEITKEEFLDWYRNPNNYRPESPSTNRSHKYE
ncbi:GH-E family nuclease, partial [Bacillus sp. V33-4]